VVAHTQHILLQAGRRLDSVPSPNVADAQTMTDSMTDMQILGSNFWALRGLNQKSKKTVLLSATWRTASQTMARFHRETKEKNQFEVGLSQTDRWRYRQSQLQKIIDS